MSKSLEEAVEKMFPDGHCGHCGSRTRRGDRCFNCGFDIPNVVLTKQAIIDLITREKAGELAQTCLASMPELTSKQQAHITNRIKELSR